MRWSIESEYESVKQDGNSRVGVLSQRYKSSSILAGRPVAFL